MKQPIVLFAVLLSACGSSPSAPAAAQEATAVELDRNSPSVRAQFVRLRHSRAGAWSVVSLGGTPALFARDKLGSRLLILRETSGYDVFRIDVDCANGAAWRIEDGRGASNDAALPTDPSVPPSLDIASEMRRMCSLKTAPAPMALDRAVGMLRKGVSRMASRATTPSALPSASASPAMQTVQRCDEVTRTCKTVTVEAPPGSPVSEPAIPR